MIYLFDCAICERPVEDFIQRNGKERPLAPICLYCESAWSDRAPSAGNFMDRRVTRQISALANALRNKAACIEWGDRHGSA